MKKRILVVFIALFSIGCLSACGTKEKVIEKDENGQYKTMEDYYAVEMKEDILEKCLSKGMCEAFEKTATEVDENEVYLKFYLKKDSVFSDDDYVKLVGAIYTTYSGQIKIKEISAGAVEKMNTHVVVYGLDDVIKYSCKMQKGTTKEELQTELSEYMD